MTRAAIRPAWIALLAAWLLWSDVGAGARQATPPPTSALGDAVACAVAPMPPERRRVLLEVGLAARATPIVPPSGATAVPGTATPLPGEPADPETVAAITAAARDFTACSNAGDLPATLALMTDETAALYLAALALIPDGDDGATPDPVSLTPIDLDATLATVAILRPRDEVGLASVVEVRGARLLPDGRVRATVVWTSPQTAPATYDGMVDFCLEGGRYLWHVAPPRRCDGAAPTLATPDR